MGLREWRLAAFVGAGVCSGLVVFGEAGADGGGVSLGARLFLIGAGLVAGWALVVVGSVLARGGRPVAAVGLAVLLSGVQSFGSGVAVAVGNFAGGYAMAALAHVLVAGARPENGRAARAVVGLGYAVQAVAVAAYLWHAHHPDFPTAWAALLLAAYGAQLVGLLLCPPRPGRLGRLGAAVLLVFGVRQALLLWPDDRAHDGLGAAALALLLLWPLGLLGVAVADRLKALTRRQSDLAAKALAAESAARGRIERDLHDGAQQRLAGALLLLAGERTDPAWHRVREEILLALGDLRELAYGTRPPVLAECGLVPALRAIAESSPLRISVTAADDWPPTLPAAAERDLYFAVAEAVANAAKHGRAERVHIALDVRAGALEVSVSDDGIGGAVPRPDGALADRADALGARLTLDSPPGRGTRVVLRMPDPGSPLGEVRQDGEHPPVVVPRLG